MRPVYFATMPLAMLCFVVGRAAAADASSADVQVRQIRATTSNTEISPELKDIAEQLKRQFRFTGFKLIGKASAKATTDKAADVALTGKYSATVKLVSRAADRLQLKIEIFAEKDGKKTLKTSTTVDVAVGKYALIGGLALDGGDTLILAFSAK